MAPGKGAIRSRCYNYEILRFAQNDSKGKAGMADKSKNNDPGSSCSQGFARMTEREGRE